MSRYLALYPVFWILGCASAPMHRLEIGPDPEREPSHAVAPPEVGVEAVPSAEIVSTDEEISAADPAEGFDADPDLFADAVNQSGYPPPQQPPPQQPFSRSRFTLKGGYYSFEDTDHLDDGYIIQGSWLNSFTKNFGTEVEVGYFDADGKSGLIETDIWGIPFMFNARLSLPLKAIELYGGAGIGSIYYDISVKNGSDPDGWLAAADTFLGAALVLKNGIVLGVEGKYYFTESVSSLDGGLDAFAAMLTLGIAR
jgi:hypothetical protein